MIYLESLEKLLSNSLCKVANPATYLTQVCRTSPRRRFGRRRSFDRTEIDEGLAEDDLETNLQRDKNARLCNMVNQLVDELTPSALNFQLRDACDQLIKQL